MARRKRSWSGMLRTAEEPILPTVMAWHGR